ncbi:sarcoplasmic calcium-binding protein 1-like [Copidosoma floridanum]|uniref:sarcoplasmic calcium-binding protein 1-like n=1 Tax=Copidosoma floridanum TaxID=29053 RepID=UPI000C6F72C0|nr:sarcoplasmic calcium-binding protein 1-like [Copidosoma floridanum]
MISRMRANEKDTDGNGILEQNDFECMALKMTILEGKGVFNNSAHQDNVHVMLALWDEIAQIADFNKDGMVTNEEFKDAVKKCCVGKSYGDFPQAMKSFIDNHFRIVDMNGDGVIGIEEYRYNSITRIPIADVGLIDEAYHKLVNDDDKRRGGLTLSRYQELYAAYLGDPNEQNPAVYLFGPLPDSC